MKSGARRCRRIGKFGAYIGRPCWPCWCRCRIGRNVSVIDFHFLPLALAYLDRGVSCPRDELDQLLAQVSYIAHRRATSPDREALATGNRDDGTVVPFDRGREVAGVKPAQH
jgi:hypothetical protein